MGQLLAGMTATGSYDDASTADITTQVDWSVSDTSITSIGLHTGLLTTQPAGKIWGATVGVTATLAPGTPGTASLLVIASDSGSIAPRMPQQNDHWVALGISPWGSWWGLQEPSGTDTLVGSGSAGFNLTRFDGTGGDGTGVHQAATNVGWTRVGIVLSGTSGGRISAAAGVGPDPSATSVGWLGYCQLDQDRTVSAQGFIGMRPTTAANQISVGMSNPVPGFGLLRLFANAGNKQLVGPNTARHEDRIHPVLFIYNRTTAECWAMTDENIAFSGGQAAIADDTKGFGARSAGGITAPSASLVWFAMATGSIVERLCDQSASADFLSRLGWNVAWKTCPTDSGSIKCPFLKIHFDELGLQTWTATWNMQDPAGYSQNSYDRWQSFQTDGWALAGAGTKTEESLAAGWKRRAVVYTQGTNAKSVRSCVGQMQWDPTGSFALVGYVSASVGSAANRGLMGFTIGSSVAQPLTCYVAFPAAGTTTPVIYCAGATATGSQSIADGRYHPILMVYDKTNSRVKLYTDLEKLTGSFNALSLVANITGAIGFGGVQTSPFGAPPPMGVLWGSFTTGALAETFSDDGKASDFLKKLGWTVSW